VGRYRGRSRSKLTKKLADGSGGLASAEHFSHPCLPAPGTNDHRAQRLWKEAETARQNLHAALRKLLTSGELVAWGRMDSPLSDLFPIPASAWKSLLFRDLSMSIIGERFTNRVIFDVRVCRREQSGPSVASHVKPIQFDTVRSSTTGHSRKQKSPKMEQVASALEKVGLGTSRGSLTLKEAATKIVSLLASPPSSRAALEKLVARHYQGLVAPAEQRVCPPRA
jgi:hypothetical protein